MIIIYTITIRNNNNTTNSNNIITQLDNKKAIPSQEPSLLSPWPELEVSQDKQSIAIKHAFVPSLFYSLAIYEISLQTYTIL